MRNELEQSESMYLFVVVVVLMFNVHVHSGMQPILKAPDKISKSSVLIRSNEKTSYSQQQRAVNYE